MAYERTKKIDGKMAQKVSLCELGFLFLWEILYGSCYVMDDEIYGVWWIGLGQLVEF